MTREEIQNRLITIRSLLKRNLSRRDREEALARQAELEDEQRRLDESEREQPPDAAKVKAAMANIREILRK